MNDLNAKQASQAKLIGSLMAAVQQATACTAVEVLGALEVVKSQVAMAGFIGRPAPQAQPPSSILTPNGN